MPADHQHKQYQSYIGRWTRIRDANTGEHAVRQKATTEYLRIPKHMKFDQVGPYADSALWFGATGRTVDGLTSTIMRRPAQINLPKEMLAWLKSVDRRGTPIEVFITALVREVISIGRFGVLIDMLSTGGDPYLAGYTAESIINWRSMVVGGAPQLSLVVLQESKETPKPDDPFATETRDRYRVLQLGPTDGGGPNVYTQTIWEKQKVAGGRETLVAIEGPITPTRRGEPLDFIPFQFFAPANLDAAISDSPIEGLVSINLSHYRTSAEIEHSAWHVGHPTYVVIGKLQGSNDSTELQVGPSTAWQIEQGGDVKIIQAGPGGLAALENRLTKKEEMMAVLGARLLEPRKTGVESAVAIDMRHRGERSLLGSIAGTTERGLSRALSVAAWWITGQKDMATVELNKDFSTAAMSPAELVQLVTAWQSGGIGGETLFYNLKAGERLPEGMTFDDWKADIQLNGATAEFIGFEEDEPGASPDA